MPTTGPPLTGTPERSEIRLHLVSEFPLDFSADRRQSFRQQEGRPSAPSPVEDTDVPCQVADAFRDLRRPGYAP